MKKTYRKLHSYLRIETPGKNSIFLSICAARFKAVIPLTDKHVTVSLLAKQLATIDWNVGGLSKPATANAKTADNTTNNSILNDSMLLKIVVCSSQKYKT